MSRAARLRRFPLPAPATALVGRRRAIADVRALLLAGPGRLVTLTGPPGVGKTRLALAVAAELAGQSETDALKGTPAFPDGVCFVPLEPVSDAALVPVAIAEALRLRAARDILEAVRAYLRSRRLLLVLDNTEQVLGAAPVLAGLLAGSPGLSLLVTSRAPLRLYGERLYPVPPLAVPAQAAPVRPAEVGKVAAVRLFVERVQAVAPSFRLTAENALTVAELCRRLDGLPLAIELAAARVRHLPPATLLARLAGASAPGGAAGESACSTDGTAAALRAGSHPRRLRLLVGGARDLPERHQSLRAAIAWSYGLLSPAEQALLRPLAVMVGGCDLAAAEAVCRPGWGGAGRGDHPRASGQRQPGGDVLEGLAALVDTGLLWQTGPPSGGPTPGEPRFGMLETIQEFALERLAESGEEQAVRQRHAAHYLSLAESATAHAGGPEEGLWLARLDADAHNLRAALAWLEATAATEARLRLAGALSVYWQTRGLWREGAGWLERALAETPCEATPLRARALEGAGSMAHFDGDHARAAERYAEAIEAWSQLGDRPGQARALQGLADLAEWRGDYDRAEALYRESLTLRCREAETAAPAETMFRLGVAAMRRGDHAGAGAYYDAALGRWRAAGNRLGMAMCYDALGGVAEEQGDYARAHALIEGALAIKRAFGDRPGIAGSLSGLSVVARLSGDHRRAVALAEEAVALTRELADLGSLAYRLYVLCLAACAADDGGRALAVWREAIALNDQFGTPEHVMRRLEGLAEVVLGGAPDAAARAAGVLGAAAALRETAGVLPRNVQGLQRRIDAVRAALTPAAFASAWAQGRSMTPERAVEAALAPQPARPAQAALSTPLTPLTPREREVAALIAEGLTNREIAARLVITRGTAAVHVGSILRKLDLATRGQVAAWVITHGEARGRP